MHVYFDFALYAMFKEILRNNHNFLTSINVGFADLGALCMGFQIIPPVGDERAVFHSFFLPAIVAYVWPIQLLKFNNFNLKGWEGFLQFS